MRFDQPLQTALLLRRYKRFLADVRLPGGNEITVHCPNTGSMKGCIAEGAEARLARSSNPKRKYPYTLEMTIVNGVRIGVNTSRTNGLVREAIEGGLFPELGDVQSITPEVQVSPGTRLDFLVQGRSQKVYIEVKNCTLVKDGVAMFPDAVTTRGQKHLRELLRLHDDGYQAVVIFCVQRQDAGRFRPAVEIDPEYGALLKMVASKGVLAFACQADLSDEEIKVVRRLPVDLETGNI